MCVPKTGCFQAYHVIHMLIHELPTLSMISILTADSKKTLTIHSSDTVQSVDCDSLESDVRKPEVEIATKFVEKQNPWKF